MNTSGRVVGESASSGKASSAADPPLSELDALQLLLDLGGMVPGAGAIADLLNAAISAARGDWLGMALSIFSAAPAVGDAAALAKIAKNGPKYAEALAVVEAKVLPKLPDRIAKPLKDFIEQAKKKLDELTQSKTSVAPKKHEQTSSPGNGSQVKGSGKGKGPCDHLRQGTGSGPYRGGAHSKTSKPVNDGKDSHHMPADDISPLARNDGPAIQMDPSDHRLTKSNGTQPGSAKYRAKLDALLQNGRWREAMLKEIGDIRRIQNLINSPGKYNEAMLEMLEYFKCLEANGLLP